MTLFGITDRHLLRNHFNLNGRILDAVEHRVANIAWKTLKPNLEHLATRIARRLMRNA